MKYSEYSKEELEKEYKELNQKFEDIKAKGLKINMMRGVPCKEQLALSMPMLDVLNANSVLNAEDGMDCRNYGGLLGIPDCKKLMGEMMGVNPDNVIIFGNSSLNIMYTLISHAYAFGVNGSAPWCKLDKPVKWLCPTPGYDRHFAITESFGFEMINIPMNQNGPDMDMIEELVKDEMVKGIWCVPKYANPNGISYSDEVVERFAKLQPAAKDFRIYWDNAYAVHHLNDDNQDEIVEIIDACAKANNPDLVYEFASTSKISFPGAGVSCLITSLDNIDEVKKFMTISTIGYDKINQLRHVAYFKDYAGIKEQMRKQAKIIKPKFELIDAILTNDLAKVDKVSWTKPHGGYFISLEVLGIASEVVARCKEAGVLLTPAGSAYPYHKDPNNSNIRIAPTFPSIEDIDIAISVLTLAVKLETVKNILEK